MSVQAITYVLDHSEAAGSDRLVLIALANHACSEKAECWPSVRLLAREARCSERTVQYALRELEHAGRIRRQKAKGPQGTTRWRLVFDAATEADRPALPKGADAAPPAEPDDAPQGADAAPGADSAGAQDATPGGANDDTPGVQTSAPEPSEGTVREPSAAANAAAAGEPAGGSSSVGTGEDPADVFYDRAADMLVAAGFTPGDVSGDRLKLRTELRKHAAVLPRVRWDALTAQVVAGRQDRSIHADTPTGVLAFALRQRGEAHLEGGAGRPPAVPPPAGGSPAAQAQNRAVNDRLEIPAPDEATAAAWRELAEALRETTQWAAGLDRQIGGLMDGVLPLRVVGDVLEVTGAQAVASFIEERAVPVFDRFAASRRFGRVRWVPRDVAAQITTTGRTAA